MAQITWRNIDAPDLTGVARMQQVGSQNIRDALSGLLGTFQEQRDLSQTNFATGKARNTAELQSKLLGFGTPEEMEAARTEFTPEALKQQYGAMYDQGAINQLVADRPTQLRQQMLGQLQLTEAQQAAASQPFENQFYSILANNPDQAAQFLKANESNFADSRQMYMDLAARKNQLEELGLRRAQLNEGRSAQRLAAKEKKAASEYAQELNAWRLENPGVAIGAKASELQKKHGINPLQGNQITAAVEQNISVLGAPTGEQAALIAGATQQNGAAVTQFKEDARRELDAALISTGVDPNFINLQQDKKTSADDVLKSFKERLSDPNEATEAYTRIKKEYPTATPATVNYILEKSLTPNRFTDGVSVSFSKVEANAKQARESASNTSTTQMYKDSLRDIDMQANDLFREAQAPVAQFQRSIPKFNMGLSTEAPTFNPVVPDYTAKREEIRKRLQSQLSNPKLNTATQK